MTRHEEEILRTAAQELHRLAAHEDEAERGEEITLIAFDPAGTRRLAGAVDALADASLALRHPLEVR